MQQELSDEEWKEYIHALELFNAKYFWECHEVLEDIWMIKQPPLKIFLQGIIQAAAAFYHVLNENPRGAIKLAQDAQAKLQSFGEKFLELEIASLKISLKKFQQEAQDMIDNKRELFSLDQIPVLKIPELAR